MKLGIVGLANVGKSTLFNALTNAKAQATSYAFSTVEPNVGVVNVPDKRLDELAKMYSPLKVTPATIEFVDIAGLVSGASRGEGLGNKFLSHIREVDAIVHVVRCFEDENIIHISGDINPIHDIETVDLELIMADAEILSRRIDRTTKALKGDKSLAAELSFLEKVFSLLNDGVTARSIPMTEDEKSIIETVSLLTLKPVIYVCNMGENDFSNGIENNEKYLSVCEFAKNEGSEVLPICAELEAQISSLPPEEREMFLVDLGISTGGLDLLIERGYDLLGLMSFLTAGRPEVRAWTINKGTKAPVAAGKIHSDLQRGFIRAEVVAYDDLIKCGSMAAAKEKGLVRLEGKEYIVKDGDVILFRFNV
ncbi:MAG TPA: redox-regulated ATPase YchF [Clostridia bacterium]|nr:redox-regulated ATPase YchF [Clostridia bacterium]